MSLTEFLLARLAEDEAVARAVHKFDQRLGADWTCAVKDGSQYADGWGDEEWPCETIRALAARYADHAEFDPSWALD